MKRSIIFLTAAFVVAIAAGVWAAWGPPPIGTTTPGTPWLIVSDPALLTRIEVLDAFYGQSATAGEWAYDDHVDGYDGYDDDDHDDDDDDVVTKAVKAVKKADEKAEKAAKAVQKAEKAARKAAAKGDEKSAAAAAKAAQKAEKAIRKAEQAAATAAQWQLLVRR